MIAMIQLDEETPMCCKVIGHNTRAEDFLNFLEELAEMGHLSQGDVLVLDNAKIHKANRILPDLINLCGTYGFSIRYLPAYSPELNPIEYIFGILKTELRKTLYRNYPIGAALAEAIASQVNFEIVLKTYAHSIIGCFEGYAL